MTQLAIVTDCLSRNAGGLQIAVQRLAQEMQRRRCDVSVFGVADGQEANEKDEWEPLQPQIFPRCGPRFFGYAPRLAAAIKSAQPDVIQLHGLWKFTTIAVMRVHSALGCPCIVNPHGMLDPWATRHSRWKKQLAKWLYEGKSLRRAACIRALCQSEANAIRAYGLRNPICVVPNGVDLHSEAMDRRTAESPFPSGPKVLLYLGRLHPKKGLTNLLSAWALLKNSEARCRPSNEWVLAIAGWAQGQHERELRQQVLDLALGTGVTFLGPRFGADKEACFRNCDAVVLPSFSEGLPMVVLEAWAHGKPVLMTAECNLPDGFSSHAAIRADPSPDSIAGSLRELFAMSDSDRRAMGKNGFDLVMDRYNWGTVAQQMHEVQEWVLGGGPAPPMVEFT